MTITIAKKAPTIGSHHGAVAVLARKPDGKYSINFSKAEELIAELGGLILQIQATGDLDAALELENNYSKKGANNDADVLAAGLEKIPADIRFNFVR